MVEDSKIKEIYSQIQKQLFYMIPEKWDKVYLYSSILERPNHMETGEMFFYYVPKGVLKKNPVNVYEIPNKFNMREEEYFKLADKLYATIKKLRNAHIKLGRKKWHSIVVSIADFKFNVEYNYEDLNDSRFNSYERHIIFRYKYLDFPYSSYTKKEKRVVEEYLQEYKYNKEMTKIYTEPMYEAPFQTIKINSKDSNIRFVKEEEVKQMENQRSIKNQILKY